MAFPIDPETMPFTADLVPDAEPSAPAAPDAGPFSPAPLSEEERLRAAMPESELVQLCRECKDEAVTARESGDSPRDSAWQSNLDLYWMRGNHTGKADWQHKEVSSRARKAVNRFAAALKRALLQPGNFYEIEDPSGLESDIFPMIRTITDNELKQCAMTANGHVAAFPLVFSRIMKIGALMLSACAVTWDKERNRLAVDVVDPRELFFDPKGRGLYRFRQREMDKHAVMQMPFVDQRVVAELPEWRSPKGEQERNQSTGHTEGASPTRRHTVLVDEFLFDVLLDQDGNEVGRNVLVVMANEQRIIRGPEPNPYWHGSDWIVAHPLIDSPLSIYGASYVEDFASVSRTFDEFTNLLLDGMQVQMLPNFAMRPEWLQDPTQVNKGIEPFKLWLINDLAPLGQQWIERLELGRVGRESIDILRAIAEEFREATSQNEIGLGQFAPKGQVTATEIQAVSESQSELVQDIAENIDAGIISPIVRLAWYTTLQHIDPSQPNAMRALGADIAGAIATRREEFRERSFGFRATAVTGLAARAAKARNIMALLQVLSQNPIIAQAFLQSHSLPAVLEELWPAFGMDSAKFKPRMTDPMPPAVGAPPGGGALPAEAGPPTDGGAPDA